MSGAGLAAVQRIMRHQDPRTTTEFYGHLATSYLKTEVDRLSFGPPPSDPGPAELSHEQQSLRAAGGAGALLLSARLDRAGQPVAEAQGRLSLPLARELLPAPDGPRSGRALLEAMAQRTGGGEARTVEAVLDAGRDHVSAHRSLRVSFVVAAILVFLADVALRRVRLRRS